jgi:hypothetical protein
MQNCDFTAVSKHFGLNSMLQNLISEIVYLISEIKFSVIWQNQSPLPFRGQGYLHNYLLSLTDQQ